MSKKYDFDYIIIGSGPAGRTAAFKLSKSRKRIAIVEGQSISGSDCTRDIPFAINLDFAHTYHKMTNFPAISGQDIHYSFPTIVSHQEHVASIIDSENKSKLDAAGVTRLEGIANFIDQHTIAVGSKKYTSNNFIIASGAKLKTTGISGLDTVNYLTPDTALKVRRLPKFVFVVGGGSTGCEIAEYYAELGAKVIIMERSAHLLPREDSEVGACLADYFTNELGMLVMTGAKVVALEQDNISKRVIFSTGKEEKFVRVDCIILATGSEPNLDLGLENAGVKYKASGISVDKYFQTSAKNIYAIGDVVNCAESSSERSRYEASILAANILHKGKTLPNYSGFIRSTNTFPEVATVGLNDYGSISRDRRLRKAIIKLSDQQLGKIHSQGRGFVKIYADAGGHIKGATIVAPNATTIAEELAIAIRHKTTVTEIASTPHPYYNYNYAVKLAAKKLIK